MMCLYFSVAQSSARWNGSSLRDSHERLPCASGSSHTADSIGSSENDTNSETSTADAIVNANGANHCSAMPPMNAIGTNTTTIDIVVAVTASPISEVPSRA